MATTQHSPTDLTEYCDDCEREALHDVSIQIMTESDSETNAEFSREPYRVAECCNCGHRTTQRMNNA